MTRHLAVVPLAALAALSLVVGCTTSTPDGEQADPTEPAPTEPPAPTQTPDPPDVLQATLVTPDEPTTVLPFDGPVRGAVSLSETLFEDAPLAVVAPADDQDAQLTAASTAVALGAPLLLAASGGAADEPAAGPVEEELGRLGVRTVVVVGPADVALDPADEADGADVVRVGTSDDVARLLDADLPEETVEGSRTDAVVGLDREQPVLLVPADGTAPGTGAAERHDDEPDLPPTELGEAPDGGLVLLAGGPADLAAAATARAAGWDVVVVPGGDPRARSRTVQAVADVAPLAVVAVGSAFGGAEALSWKVETAATGVELPGGGQTLFPGRRMIALYGSPGVPALGLLGEQGLAETVTRAQEYADAYEPLTDDVVVPAFEIIVTVASAGAGPDGQYSNRLPAESFVPWVEAAQEAGVYVVLDLQPGRTDFLTQAREYEELLRYPHVGLALDPEWRLLPDQVHLRQIGHVEIDEVNAVVDYLADLTREHALPQKLLVLHQFRLAMIRDRERLHTTRDELAVLIHADGQGSQPAKQDTWRALRAGAPEGVWWGWKNFIDEDTPMLTPEQTFEGVSPVPDFVSYQ